MLYIHRSFLGSDPPYCSIPKSRSRPLQWSFSLRKCRASFHLPRPLSFQRGEEEGGIQTRPGLSQATNKEKTLNAASVATASSYARKLIPFFQQHVDCRGFEAMHRRMRVSIHPLARLSKLEYSTTRRVSVPRRVALERSRRYASKLSENVAFGVGTPFVTD